MQRLTRLFLYSVMAFATLGLAQATILDLAPPGLNPTSGIDVGNAEIGTIFLATSTFTINSAGINFNAFGNVTPQPDTYQLDVFIYAVSGGVRGALLSSATYCIGPCVNQTLFPANVQGGAKTFLDVPIAFTFLAGNTYAVQFNVNNGWGSGLQARNEVEFYFFDPTFPNNPPNTLGSPYTVGPVQVLDGAFSADLTNKNFAHVRLMPLVLVSSHANMNSNRRATIPGHLRSPHHPMSPLEA